MKTKFYYLMMCLCIALSAVSFVSCGDDDNDGTTPTTLSGVYRGQEIDYGRYTDITTYTITFKSSNTCTYNWHQKTIWSDGDVDYYSYSDEGTYKVSGRTVTFNWKECEYFKQGTLMDDGYMIVMEGVKLIKEK